MKKIDQDKLVRDLDLDLDDALYDLMDGDLVKKCY